MVPVDHGCTVGLALHILTSAVKLQHLSTGTEGVLRETSVAGVPLLSQTHIRTDAGGQPIKPSKPTK